MKTLILALGNPILSDDGVAYEVADRLGPHMPDCDQLDIIKSSAATMDIIPQLAGYDRLVVVDAIQLGSGPPGVVHRFSLEKLAETLRISSPHDTNFATALQIGKEWGYHIPEDIRIYGIEVKELLKFSEGCTPEVSEKLDEIAEQIARDLLD
jgi:hydrogenase maturation protease